MAASVVKEYVLKRGHVVEEYPIVLDRTVEELTKTKDVLELLKKLNLKKEIERSAKKTEKTGNARRRGRKNKKRKGPLFVVSKKCALMDSASNIPGIDIIEITCLNAELLAPGCEPGRLTLYTQSAIEILEKNKLFTDYIVHEKKEQQEKQPKQENKKTIKTKSKKIIKPIEK